MGTRIMSGLALLRRYKRGSAVKLDFGESTMSDFTFLYRGRDTNASPEQMQKTMEKWRSWFKDLGEKGHLKDIGHPLENSGKVVKGKQKNVTDGPFAGAVCSTLTVSTFSAATRTSGKCRISRDRRCSPRSARAPLKVTSAPI